MVLDVDVDVEVDEDGDGATVLELRQGILNKYILSFSYSFRTAFVYETAEPPNGRSISYSLALTAPITLKLNLIRRFTYKRSSYRR